MIPYDGEIEKGILGAILLSEENISQIVDFLKPEDFFVDIHRMIYQAAISLFEDGKKIDFVSLLEELSKNGMSREQIASYLKSLIDSVNTSAGILSLARCVKEFSKRRQLIQCCQRIMERCEIGEDPDLLRKELSEILLEFLEENREKKVLSSEKLAEVTGNFITEAVLGKAGAVKSGYEFDSLTGGFFPGELYVFAARPGMGKTALAINVAYRCAMDGKVCLFFSLEMPAFQLGMRLVAIDSEIEIEKLRKGLLDAKEQELVTQSLDRLSRLPLFIDESTDLSVVDIRAKALRIQRAGGLDLIFVDYLQLVRGSKKDYENRQSEVADVAESLKKIARDLNVPVLAFAQLNRRVEDRVDKKPQLADLRYSGEIEQAADVVAFIYRDEVYNPERKSGETEIIIAKNRNGDTGISKLVFRKDITRFENPDF